MSEGCEGLDHHPTAKMINHEYNKYINKFTGNLDTWKLKMLRHIRMSVFILDEIHKFVEIKPVVCPIIISKKEHDIKRCICCDNMPKYRQILQTHVNSCGCSEACHSLCSICKISLCKNHNYYGCRCQTSEAFIN